MVSVSDVTYGRVPGARAVSVMFAAVAAAAMSFDAGPAGAVGYVSSQDDDRPRATRKDFSHKSVPAPRDAKRAETASPERPLFVVVSIGDQRLSVYNRHGLVERSTISTGIPGHPTPKGIFSIVGRERIHHSNIYSGAPMPFMQRITWSGIAMHLGVVPGHPASHGCIRLPAGFAARLWGLTRIGERVVIAPHDVAPEEFTHPLLPAPKMQVLAEADAAPPALDSRQAPIVAEKPPLIDPRRYAERMRGEAAARAAAAVKGAKEAVEAVGAKRQEVARAAQELRAAETASASARVKAKAASDALDAAKDPAKEAATAAKTKADAALAEAEAKLDAAKTASAAKEAELADAVKHSSEAAAQSEAAAKAEKEAALRLTPLSVLVSKKDRRIYVRQGLTPLFDAPANVRDPETPLGSHLYIATAAEGEGASLKWSVVSMPARAMEEQGERKKKRTASIDERIGAPPKPAGASSSPAEALERIEIADDIRDRIAERLWTGASIIISDQPLSGETGSVGTDLTVKLR